MSTKEGRSISANRVATALVLFVGATSLLACKDKSKDEAAAKAACPTCIIADERGFTPSRLEVPAAAGEREVTFTRTSDDTCATEVVFPDLGIKQALPLKQPVTIKLPAGEKKTYAFQCGMGMYKSAVVVQ
jgi:plastocyanin domain-containing protein